MSFNNNIILRKEAVSKIRQSRALQLKSWRVLFI